MPCQFAKTADLLRHPTDAEALADVANTGLHPLNHAHPCGDVQLILEYRASRYQQVRRQHRTKAVTCSDNSQQLDIVSPESLRAGATTWQACCAAPRCAAPSGLTSSIDWAMRRHHQAILSATLQAARPWRQCGGEPHHRTRRPHTDAAWSAWQAQSTLTERQPTRWDHGITNTNTKEQCSPARPPRIGRSWSGSGDLPRCHMATRHQIGE